MKLSPEAIDYLLRHAPRDMGTLAALVDSPNNFLIQYQVAWIVLQKPLPGQLDLDHHLAALGRPSPHVEVR